MGVGLRGLGLRDRHQVVKRRQQPLVQGQRRGHVDGAGHHVVAALAGVDLVVGVHRRAQRAAGQRGDHLVGVHVGRGAGTGLVHVDGEMRVVFARGHRPCGVLHGLGDALGQQAQPGIDLGRGALDQPQRADEATRHRPAGDGEVLHRPLRLRTPQRIGRHVQFAHAVVFDAGACGAGLARGGLLAGHQPSPGGIHGVRTGADAGGWRGPQDTPGRFTAFPG